MIKLLLINCVALLAMLFPQSLLADADVVTRPFLLLGMSDGTLKEYEITDNLKLIPDINGVLSVSEIEELDLGDLLSLGIAYKEVTSTGVENIEESFDLNQWIIYDLDGSIKSIGNNGKPDFSKLDTNKTYIVKLGTKTFKYLHLK